MNLFITAPTGELFDRYFPSELIERLEKLGTVRRNPFNRQLTVSELQESLKDCEIVLTHWGTPQIDASLLERAPRLRILAHCAGTVARIASAACYERNVHVLSANSIMAKYVAEGALGMILASLREFTQYDAAMRQGKWEKRLSDCLTLIGAEVGFIGLGTVGRRLLELIAPFGCRAKVFDPYLPEDALVPYPFAQTASFQEAMQSRIVTVHASQTPETFHLIDADALSLLPDGGLLVNSSRGSLVDTEALIAELQTGRIRAALDVYEHENAAQDARLLACPHVLLQPHMAAAPAQSEMTAGIISNIERLLSGKNAPLEISYAQYVHMTQE